MGKRSSFERREADFYPTPAKAVLPLVPFLRGIRTFAEPCAGEGDLVRHLESFGLRCVYAGDIITNPPWSRDVLHGLITHFQNIAPTWLLLDSDWAQTKQAAPFLPSCSDIVAIGRVKWIEGSKHTGKDNAGWYRFDARHKAGPVFHGRNHGEAVPSRRTRTCEQCGRRYELQRASARFCSAACKQLAYRKRLSVTPSVTSAPSDCSEFRYVRHARSRGS